MALGEFVSVSAQRDSEQFWVAKERQELREVPEEDRGASVSVRGACRTLNEVRHGA